MKDSEKIILDLCAGTGAWSDPYAQAGYDVRRITLPEYDVRYYKPPRKVYGILMAVDCTHFSGSGAQYWKAKDLDGRTLEAVLLVKVCLDIKDYCKPVFWSLENPVGRINKLLPEIGEKKLVFDPCDYGGYSEQIYRCPCGYEFEYELGKYGCPNCLGENIGKLVHLDAYTKRTILYGNFNIPEKRRIEPVKSCSQGSWVQTLGGKSARTKELRSITPPGFARAFFEANR
jgi:hypothetical protein